MFKCNGFVTYENRSDLPTRSGVYVVMSDNEVVYVGKSINIKTRFLGHHKHRNFVRLNNPIVCWIEAEKRFIQRKEYELIKQYRPRLNKVTPSYLPIPDPIVIPALPQRDRAAELHGYYNVCALPELFGWQMFKALVAASIYGWEVKTVGETEFLSIADVTNYFHRHHNDPTYYRQKNGALGGFIALPIDPQSKEYKAHRGACR